MAIRHLQNLSVLNGISQNPWQVCRNKCPLRALFWLTRRLRVLHCDVFAADKGPVIYRDILHGGHLLTSVPSHNGNILLDRDGHVIRGFCACIAHV